MAEIHDDTTSAQIARLRGQVEILMRIVCDAGG